jgi:hypothetical protein
MEFKFKLGQVLSIGVSLETGFVVARAEYMNQENQYLLRYKAADGRAVEQWWPQSALIEAIEEDHLNALNV